MKALSSLLLLALVTLAGCSADDLSGPDAATDAFALAAQAPASEAARNVPSAPPFSATGTWQASDELGTLTLLLDESAGALVMGTAEAAVTFGGRGVVSGVASQQISGVTVVGQYKLEGGIEIALLDRAGEALAKGHGQFSVDRSAFKVELTYDDRSQRSLEFTRL